MPWVWPGRQCSASGYERRVEGGVPAFMKRNGVAFYLILLLAWSFSAGAVEAAQVSVEIGPRDVGIEGFVRPGSWTGDFPNADLMDWNGRHDGLPVPVPCTPSILVADLATQEFSCDVAAEWKLRGLRERKAWR